MNGPTTSTPIDRRSVLGRSTAPQSARSEAIRDALVEHVSQAKPGRTRARRWLIGGAAFGGLVIAGGGIAYATGVFTPQGADIITPLTNAVIQEGSGSAVIDLGARPQGTSGIEVTVFCLTPGTVEVAGWGSIMCGSVDVGREHKSWGAIQDPAAAALTTVTVTADPDMRWHIEAVYINVEQNEWGVNANGETYGVSNDRGDPDLIRAEGTAPDGSRVVGYIRATQATGGSPLHDYALPANPEQAIAWQDENARVYPNGWDIPLFESDGVTQIGVFRIGRASPQVTTLP
jgi:hypothetical protein